MFTTVQRVDHGLMSNLVIENRNLSVVPCNRKTNIHAVRTSGDKSVSSLPPSSGTLLLFSFLATQWRELINFSPDVLTA